MKYYSVEMITENKTVDYGMIEEAVVKEMLKNYTFDKEMNMWFSRKAQKAYIIEEVE